MVTNSKYYSIITICCMLYIFSFQLGMDEFVFCDTALGNDLFLGLFLKHVMNQ